ncbi:uncharacterized protein LOC101857548 [Aplysia californica]|uniref:Uncharacterized protein LOC101857548 n=1 Tax=Aplysia californica TaxID=6500 RepID=A0ABM0ZUT3_APLCA|nr:uncharacterized protein LOC101857548 [Aplysia californica]
MSVAILLVCCLAVSVSCQSLTSEPPRCCQPRQWRGILGGVGSNVYPLTGNVVPVDSYTFMTYDYDRKKIGLEVHFRLHNNTERVVQSLLDFGTDQMFLYEDGKCTVAKIGEPIQEPCVPASARFLSTSVFGYGAEMLNVNTWEIGTPGSGNVVKRSYTAGACIPVMEASYGTHNGASMNLVQLVGNFTLGAGDPRVLDTPSGAGCTYVNSKGPVYGRRAVFV